MLVLAIPSPHGEQATQNQQSHRTRLRHHAAIRTRTAGSIGEMGSDGLERVASSPVRLTHFDHKVILGD
jgi:hypothetical protein